MTPSNYKYGSISSHDDPEPGDHEIKHDSASCTCLAQLRRWNWKNITTISCLWLAYLLCNMSYSIVGPFFPDEAENKGVSSLLVGIIIGCAPLALVILSPILGYLLPLTGVIMPIFVGLLLVGTSYIALAFILQIHSTTWFIVVAISLRLVEGAGSAMFVTATFATLPKLFPDHISTIVGLIEVAAGFGYAIGPPVGGVLYQLGGYKIPFLSMGGAVLVLVIPSIALVWRIKIETEETLSIKTVFRISTSLTFIAVAFALVLAYACFGFFETTIQPFLIRKFGVSNEHIGFMLCTGAVSYVVISLVIGPVLDKIGYNRVFMIVGVAICTLSYALIGFITFIGHWYIFLLCGAYFLIGAGSALGVVPAYSDMLKLAERYTSKTESEAAIAAFISGIISSSMYFGAFSGNLIGGLLTDYLSFPRSAVIVGEILLAEVLLLTGVTLVDRLSYS